MKTAATLALLGLPALRYLETEDRDDRLILAAVANAAIKLRNEAAKHA